MKLGLTNPLPMRAHPGALPPRCEKLYVMEELDDFMEEQTARPPGIAVHGQGAAPAACMSSIPAAAEKAPLRRGGRRPWRSAVDAVSPSARPVPAAAPTGASSIPCPSDKDVVRRRRHRLLHPGRRSAPLNAMDSLRVHGRRLYRSPWA